VIIRTVKSAEASLNAVHRKGQINNTSERAERMLKRTNNSKLGQLL
jgi:hypothetical protein